MGITASFLDFRFLLLLVALGLIRWLWPSKNFALLGALASAVVVGVTAPSTFVAITGITLGFVYPLHRLSWHGRMKQWPKWATGAIIPVGMAALVLTLVLS